MYSSELINAYKKAKNYVQDKQVAHDLNLDPPKISKIRKGVRQLTDSEAVYLAENSGIDPELALLGCHADRNENPEIKQMWEHIAKKYNGLGLKAISMTCAGLALMAATPNKALANCVLCILC
ncbi:DUF3693 domain-containing protein [Vibrio sp. Sgm 22]|uniref:DUF3693 domain-containing protein n=1 Tax=unclassified Vibrio TaxID=2614977 RepID=UPI0022494179|nr:MULTISPECIES: DUF3693 domain-containing protein [unclassified Vibrio]MCX2759907.1 DUF3693 domain-containing protein [Vibrio sp. 14G-20]MCX2776894.1 DUF3693 domain-containing protein [Vibrio sp. Sgm 22]